MTVAKWTTRKGATIGRWRCCVLDDPNRDARDPIEKCLAGRYGEVWEVGDGTFKTFQANLDGSDKITSFTSNDLEMWIIRLDVPPSPTLQATYANTRSEE